MAGETDDEIPETGAVFTFGKSKFADNVPSKFWLKNDVPLKLACGDEHTALITENGKLFMFGSNNWGQLGLGEKISVNKPTCVKALKSEKVKLVACGRTHTLVYTSCGNLYAAGGNNEGQLGLGDFVERTSFQLVEFFTKCGPVKMLAAGSNTSAAIAQDGKLYMWGDNSEGQIGLGEEEGTSTPRELDIGRRMTWISCGYYHSAFVTADGALFTFGERDSGKLGLGISQLPNHRIPQQVEGICEPVLQVACGGGHTLVLTEKHLYSFGLGQFGQLGHGTFTFETLIPKAVEHFRKGRVKHIACGENHGAVLTESGLLYTFGDGRHGKLALGDEYFANQFKPTLCPRFLKYNVQAVTCGGCHMVVLAKPRLSSEVILEDSDVTEDHLEKLLREAESRHSLNRSLSARDRRRERERSPEQFGIMFRTLPPLSSGLLNVSLPASSQTLPSQLNKRTTNGFQRNGHLSSTGKLTEEHEVDGKTPVENYKDNESVKDLGETAELFNLTHVMKMDPAEETITLCPVQKRKKVKAGDKRSKSLEQLTQHPGSDRGWAGLSSSTARPTELLKSHSGKSQFGERQLPGTPHQSSESTGEDSDEGNAIKESRIIRHTVRRHRTKSASQPKSKPDLQSKLIEIKPKARANSGQEDVHKYEVKAHLSNVKVETETEKAAYKLEEKAEDLRQAGLDLKARSKTRSVDKRQRQAAEEKFFARITQVKHMPAESDSKVVNVESKSLDAEQDVKTWEGSSSGEQYNQAQVAPRKTQSTKPERNTEKTKGLETANSISSPSENTVPSSLIGVTSLTEDLPIESPVRLLKEVASSQFLSRTASINSSQTGGSRNSLDEQTLSKTASVYEDPDKNVSKRKAVTINVKPVPTASDEETERTVSQDQTEEKTENKEVECGKEEIEEITDSERLARESKRASSVESNKEERKSVAQVSYDEGQDETTWEKVSQDEEREGAEMEERSQPESEKGQESDSESEEEREDEKVSETVEQEEEESRMSYDAEERGKDSNRHKISEPEGEDSEEETESIHGEGDDSEEEEDAAEKVKDRSEEGKGSVGTAQNKFEDVEQSGNESGNEKEQQDSATEEQETEEGVKESEAGWEESREEEDGSVVGQEESEEEEGEGSEAGTKEEEESEAGKKEEQESKTGKEESEVEGEESEEEGEESEAGQEESEEEESGTEKEENAREEEESGTEQEESEGEEEESGTEKEDSEGEEDESGTEKEDSEGEEDESGTEKEESEGEEEESGTEKEESEGEEEESEGEEEESGTEKEESDGEAEESGTVKEESEGEEEESGTEKEESKGEAEEEKETETYNEEEDSEGEEEEGEATDSEKDVGKTEQENDSEGEKEEEEQEGGEQAEEDEDEDEKEVADQERRDKKKIQKDMTEEEEPRKKRKRYKMPSKQKSSKGKKTLARRRQSSFESHEPRQFWDDVLPQYLNLK